MTETPSATLKAKEERRIVRGHLWAYRNEFENLPDLEDGAVLDVFAANRRFVGRGFFQAHGGIAVRLLSRRQEPVGADFFRSRIARARELRERLYPGSSVYRWIFGESDGFPGLVVDRYENLVVMQSDCHFYGQQRAVLEALFQEEGLEHGSYVLPGGAGSWGEPDSVEDLEFEGLVVRYSVREGQKTGMFLDQRRNAQIAAPLLTGLRVLDGHCHLGIWGMRAALMGAAEVTSVDTSERAIALARESAERNGLAEAIRHVCGPVEEALACGDTYEAIILDPPAFAKSRRQETPALTRYQALNRAAIEALEPGGFLVSCSCSHFVAPDTFLEMIKRAASAAGRNATLIELRGAAPDHPVLLAMPETRYLKCAILQLD